jgi:hypothetical protein
MFAAGLSMYLSSLTAIGIWLLYSDRVMDLYGFVFNMFFISGWNAIDIATIESYPTHLRYELYRPGYVNKPLHRNGFSVG